jgi:sarcosine oxidase subunit gamma
MTPKGSGYVDKEKLNSALTLDHLNLQWPTLSITQSSFKEICSINASLDKQLDLNERFKEEYGISLPAPGKMVNHSTGSVFWVSPSQWFVTSNECNPYFDQLLTKKFNEVSTVTLQTDAWISIKIEGPASLDVLERLIKIDLSERNFPSGSATRTGCSHMTIFIQKPHQEDCFIILGARSYAKSLVHTINQVAENILGNKD